MSDEIEMAEATPVTEVDLEDGIFIASMKLYQYPDTVKAHIKVGDDPAEVIDVPPHLAGMLPMAIRQIQDMSQ